MYDFKRLKYGLAVAFAVETFCITYGLRAFPLIPAFSFIYFIAGISIAAIMLFFPQAQARSGVMMPAISSWKKSTLWSFAVLALVVFYLSTYWFDAVPMDVEHADMLPIIKIMGKRFINGQWRHVYDIIPEVWHGSYPIYLPATWMPFSIGTLLHIDIRWITSACILFVYGSALVLLQRLEKNRLMYVTAAVTVMLFWWMMTENEGHGFLSISEEGVVAAYYVFLVLAILSGNIYATAVAISLCVLSRYALIGWIPAFFVYLMLSKKFKDATRLSVVGILLFLCLFILPFGWQTFMRLALLPGDYIGFAKRVWTDSPEVFAGSLGFAKFFGSEHVLGLHQTLIGLTFSVPILFVLLCFYLKRKRKISNIPLASLKVAVVIFYNFIDVPYLYLFFTSSFVSLISVCFFLGEELPAGDLKQGMRVHAGKENIPEMII